MVDVCVCVCCFGVGCWCAFYIVEPFSLVADFVKDISVVDQRVAFSVFFFFERPRPIVGRLWYSFVVPTG